jgi:hypothetical protein
MWEAPNGGLIALPLHQLRVVLHQLTEDLDNVDTNLIFCQKRQLLQLTLLQLNGGSMKSAEFPSIAQEKALLSSP